MPRKILQQVHNRLYEIEKLNNLISDKLAGEKDLIPGNVTSYRSSSYDEMCVRTTSPNNVCGLDIDGTIKAFVIKEMYQKKEDGNMYFLGNFLDFNSSLDGSMGNSLLEFCYVGLVNDSESLSLQEYEVNTCLLKCKFVKIPFNSENSILLPLLHHLI